MAYFRQVLLFNHLAVEAEENNEKPQRVGIQPMSKPEEEAATCGMRSVVINHYVKTLRALFFISGTTRRGNRSSNQEPLKCILNTSM
jgi:hypothetical protein